MKTRLTDMEIFDLRKRVKWYGDFYVPRCMSPYISIPFYDLELLLDEVIANRFPATKELSK